MPLEVCHVGLLDVSGIQSFVFRSGKLKDVAAASAQIEALSDCKHGLIAVEARLAGAEVVAVAAGNATLTAGSADTLRAAFGAISRTLLESGEGLQIVCALCEYAPGGLARACLAAQRDLERRKLTQPRSTDFQFPGCTRPYPSIAPVPLRAARWRVPDGWAEPQKLDEMLGASGQEFGLMAVVSVDGIGMGKRLTKWAEDCGHLYGTSAEDDAKFAAEYKAWSESLKRRWRTAWEQTLDCVAGQFAPDFVMRHGTRSLRANNDRDRYSYLPCRRIYHGGDDLCFVCDARVALGMASHLVRTLEAIPPGEGVPKEFHDITAGIGVVFVDSHFPFVRAVHLSGAVLKQAKKKAVGDDVERPPSAVDWWVNRTGAMERELAPFTLKPYLLDSDTSAGDWGRLDWATLEQHVLGGLSETYAGARNKLKDLLEAAEEGPINVKHLLRLRPLEGGATSLGFVQAPYDSSTGFKTGATADSGFQTPLLDAGELYDFHFPFNALCGTNNIEDVGETDAPQD